MVKMESFSSASKGKCWTAIPLNLCPQNNHNSSRNMHNNGNSRSINNKTNSAVRGSWAEAKKAYFEDMFYNSSPGIWGL